jgi:hypothetical protein
MGFLSASDDDYEVVAASQDLADDRQMTLVERLKPSYDKASQKNTPLNAPMACPPLGSARSSTVA